jgi:hypothetical protein
MEFILEN